MSDLGIFEVSCYYFTVSSIYWDQAWKACADMGSGSKLAAIETTAEFNWVLQIYNSNYPTAGGFYVDAVTNRYGSAWGTPAWRGGMSLSSGVGSTYTVTALVNDACYSGNTYNQHFYLTSSGSLLDLPEQSTPTNIGYICKKFQSAPYPSTVGYNIGYCFPSVSGSNCPSGWTKLIPNSSPFCYYFLTANNLWEEDFRQCHTLGADMVYVESASEITFLTNNGVAGTFTGYANLNAHRFRYGPKVANSASALYW